MEHRDRTVKADSWLVAAGRSEEPGAPLNVPPIPASNFELGGGRAYSRDDGTPAWEALEQVVGGLERASSVAFASGMAAMAAVFEQLPEGSSILLSEGCYQGVSGLADAGEARGRWTAERLPVEDTSSWLEASAQADLLWIESPSNPLLAVADLERIGAAPRKPTAILAVDNTFATALNQRPLDLGATVSLQSATKFLGGHSDLLAGIATTRDESLLSALRKARELNGATPGSLETFLTLRGIRTLSLRLARSQESAGVLARRLAAHPRVTTVRYPGLESHPTHEVARRLLRGFGAVISFDLDGGAGLADTVCSSVRLVRHATSLGAVESTIERRAAVPGQEHLPPSLLRLSVGVEDVEDLWRDLDSAIGAAATPLT